MEGPTVRTTRTKTSTTLAHRPAYLQKLVGRGPVGVGLPPVHVTPVAAADPGKSRAFCQARSPEDVVPCFAGAPVLADMARNTMQRRGS